MTDDTLPNAEHTFVSRLLAQLPDLADFVATAKRLNKLLRKKGKETSDHVLEDAGGTALGEFVPSLRRDLSAVQATRDRLWTTSPAEGQINWLKMLPPVSPTAFRPQRPVVSARPLLPQNGRFLTTPLSDYSRYVTKTDCIRTELSTYNKSSTL
jgi:hypothetical protein